jgi:N-dimethylarginine dimethylaminohydrolase
MSYQYSDSATSVNIHNEWDQLEEIIIGSATGARMPNPELSSFVIDYSDEVRELGNVPSGAYPPHVIEEANADLDCLSEFLTKIGVTVRRPLTENFAQPFGTADWKADGEHAYCPRDSLLSIGNMIIETPMVLRTRYFESFAYREIIDDYFERGAQWISAPKPRLLDDTYDRDQTTGSLLKNIEPIFDAANVIRVGKDILYLISRSGNHKGLTWLSRVLGPDYRVHAVEGVYDGTHIDTTIALVRPGLVVLNPERIPSDKVPSIFRNWDIIWCPEMYDTGFTGSIPRASIWQGMNFIMVNPNLAVIGDKQIPLIRELEARKVDVARLPMRHARTLCGGFHCATLDIRRRGALEAYT